MLGAPFILPRPRLNRHHPFYPQRWSLSCACFSRSGAIKQTPQISIYILIYLLHYSCILDMYIKIGSASCRWRLHRAAAPARSAPLAYLHYRPLWYFFLAVESLLIPTSGKGVCGISVLPRQRNNDTRDNDMGAMVGHGSRNLLLLLTISTCITISTTYNLPERIFD